VTTSNKALRKRRSLKSVSSFDFPFAKLSRRSAGVPSKRSGARVYQMPNTSGAESVGRNIESCGILGTIVVCDAAKCPTCSDQGLSKKSIYLISLIFISQKKVSKIDKLWLHRNLQERSLHTKRQRGAGTGGSAVVSRSSIATFSRIYLFI